MKKTWCTKIISKTNAFKNDISKRKIVDRIETFDENKVANGFNNFFYWNQV